LPSAKVTQASGFKSFRSRQATSRPLAAVTADDNNLNLADHRRTSRSWAHTCTGGEFFAGRTFLVGILVGSHPVDSFAQSVKIASA
jgi:hypothetical protein